VSVDANPEWKEGGKKEVMNRRRKKNDSKENVFCYSSERGGRLLREKGKERSHERGWNISAWGRGEKVAKEKKEGGKGKKEVYKMLTAAEIRQGKGTAPAYFLL